MALTRPTAQKLLVASNANTTTPPPAYGANPAIIADFEDSSDEADDETLSAIRLKISVPMTIAGDNNLVAIEPATNASRVAMAVVNALKQMSMSASGIPMLDEDGRPRSIKVEVSADIKVEGSKNVCGEKAVLAFCADADAVKRFRSHDGSGVKREREDGEALEPEEKKVRTQ